MKRLEGRGASVISAVHTDPMFKEQLEDYFLYCQGSVRLLFTENESNNKRLFGTSNASAFVKDGINDYLVSGKKEAVNSARTGTKAAADYLLKVEGGQSASIQLRLCATAPEAIGDAFAAFGETCAARLAEADDFYRSITPTTLSEDEARVMRQALAGMLWSKQYFYFDVNLWLDEHNIDPMAVDSRTCRNREWFHMVNNDIISMPDKWEYPWYAAWDLAFHTMALSVVDPDFAKQQLQLMISAEYQHPSGLTRMLDENEFLSPYGIRALSRCHMDHPYLTEVRRERFEVRYLPAESDTGMFGGNSNWRGPIWMPVNGLIIRSLLQYYLYYGDNGAGLGASHQTGWTGLVARLLKLFGRLDPKEFLELGKGITSRSTRPS